MVMRIPLVGWFLLMVTIGTIAIGAANWYEYAFINDVGD
jgi:uncharacterized membrane protein YidH (DUF202 family)